MTVARFEHFIMLVTKQRDLVFACSVHTLTCVVCCLDLEDLKVTLTQRHVRTKTSLSISFPSQTVTRLVV